MIRGTHWEDCESNLWDGEYCPCEHTGEDQ